MDFPAVLHILSFVMGLIIVFENWKSIINTIVLPRSISSRITLFTWVVVHRTFQFLTDRRKRYADKDRILAYIGPISLLSMLGSWLLLFLIGYTLMFWAFIPGSFGEAIYLSISSMVTLGIFSSPLPGPIVLEFFCAITGMTIIALQIGYLPTIYSAYNRRETLVSTLHSRAGAPAWGPEILARHYLSEAIDTLPSFFAAWETWAADITESHSSYPWLMVFRSQNEFHSWVISLLAMLDAAALYLALSPSKAPPEARQCLRVGFVGLRTLAMMMGREVNPDPRPDDPIDLTYERFLHGVEHLRDAGFPLERTAEEAWPHFRGWRVNYEQAAYGLADYIVAIMAPWSGPRRHMTDQEIADVIANRPRHRTPDDPEGLGVPAGPSPGVVHSHEHL